MPNIWSLLFTASKSYIHTDSYKGKGAFIKTLKFEREILPRTTSTVLAYGWIPRRYFNLMLAGAPLSRFHPDAPCLLTLGTLERWRVEQILMRLDLWIQSSICWWSAFYNSHQFLSVNWAGSREWSFATLHWFCYFQADLFKATGFCNLVWAERPKVLQSRLKFTSKYKQGAALVNVTIH